MAKKSLLAVMSLSFKLEVKSAHLRYQFDDILVVLSEHDALNLRSINFEIGFILTVYCVSIEQMNTIFTRDIWHDF